MDLFLPGWQVKPSRHRKRPFIYKSFDYPGRALGKAMSSVKAIVEHLPTSKKVYITIKVLP